MDRVPDGSSVLGMAQASTSLIEDVHRRQLEQRRRRRLLTVAAVIAVVAAAFAVYALVRAQMERHLLASVRAQAARGTLADLHVALAQLQAAQTSRSSAALAEEAAVLHAMAWAEHAADATEAEQAVAICDSGDACALAQGLVTLGQWKAPLAVNELGNAYHHAVRTWLEAAAANLTCADKRNCNALPSLAPAKDDDGLVAPLGRLGVMMDLRAQRPEDAREHFESLRARAPQHIGLAADEAFLHAVLGDEPDGVVALADTLLTEHKATLAPIDRAHAQLARATVLTQRGERERAMEDLRAAWPPLRAWNPQAGELAVTTAIELMLADDAEAWLEERGTAFVHRDAQRAMVHVLRGQTVAALERSATLDQSDGEVAWVQALALTEQTRVADARPWVDRAKQLSGHHAALAVADARLALHEKSAEAKEIVQRLRDEPAVAFRKFTALGEANLKLTKPDIKAARAAFEQAIAVESAPAAAHVALAELLRRHDKGAHARALQHNKQAAQASPDDARYVTAYGLALMHDGFAADAQAQLHKALDLRGATAKPALALMYMAPAGDRESFDKLTQRAQALGAPPARISLEQIRFAYRAREVPLATTRTQLQALVAQNPRLLDARLFYIDVLLERDELDEARRMIRQGFAFTRYNEEGRLWFAQARYDVREAKRKSTHLRARTAWMRMLAEDRPVVELLESSRLAVDLAAKAGRAAGGLAVARQLTEHLPEQTLAWTIRAQAELDNNDAGAAKASAEKAIDRDKTAAEAHALLGHALVRLGQVAAAKSAYEKALANKPAGDVERQVRRALARL